MEKNIKLDPVDEYDTMTIHSVQKYIMTERGMEINDDPPTKFYEIKYAGTIKVNMQ